MRACTTKVRMPYQDTGGNMSRRKKSSLLEDLLDLLALLPWWVCLLLAGLSHVLLHRLAAPLQASDFGTGAVVQKALINAFATIGQYLAPLLCLAAAGLSAWRRKQRRGLIADVAQARSADALDGMNWREFELLVGQAFRQRGYRVIETGGGGPDGGVDLVLTKGGEKFLVQCKQWKAYKVGVDVVRALFGVMAARGSTGGFVVTSGRFTTDARDFARGRNIELIDGPRLFAMIQRARENQAPAESAVPMAGADTAATTKAAELPTKAQEQAPTAACPRCGSAMKLRVARQGANAGNAFWGCVTYPACRGTRAVESTQPA